MKVDYMSRLVQVDVCSEANKRIALQSLLEWERVSGKIERLVTDGGHISKTVCWMTGVEKIR